MPRTYVKHSTKSYSDVTLAVALKEIEKGKSIYKASKEFNIPYESLRRWVVDRPTHFREGRNTYLTHEEEKCIVEALQFLGRCGYPFDRHDVLNLVETYFQTNKNRKNPFPNNGKPGIDFIRSFEKRWAEKLGKRKPEILTKARASDFSLDTVNAFFDLYEKLLNENNLQNQPERIFNLDEIGLATDPRSTKVFVGKSDRVAYMKTPNAGKCMYTVLFCISATGVFMPPFTVYKGLNLYNSWTVGGPPGGLYACTESGWMMDHTFESYIKHFINHVKDLEKPVLLIYDGHGSHMTYDTIKKSIENGVIILCLPPNTSHALQPLDVGVFSALKKVWRGILKSWFRETRLQNVSKSTFPCLLKRLCDSLKPENAINGFRGAGLYPPNRETVKHRIVFTENNILPSSENSSEILQNMPSTSGVSASKQKGHEVPEVEDTQTVNNSTCVSSPLKDLKLAILKTLSPSASNDFKNAVENSKRKRKRVQCKVGEVLTAEKVVERLYTEKEEREMKKTIKEVAGPSSIKKVPYKKNAESSKIVDISKIKQGSWIETEYAGKKSVFQFIGQVIEKVEEEEVKVKFLKHSKIGRWYTFPEKDDIDIIETKDIIRILPEPTFDNRGHYSFDM